MPHLPKAVCAGTSTTEFTTATCLSSEQLYLIRSQRIRCNSCRTSLRCNCMWLGDQKINCVSFNQLKAAGVFFVSQKTAFAMQYLHLCYLRLLREKTSPGLEAAVHPWHLEITRSSLGKSIVFGITSCIHWRGTRAIS